MRTVFGVLVIGAASLAAALAQSWIVQGGDNPVRVRTDRSLLQSTVIPIAPSDADGGGPGSRDNPGTTPEENSASGEMVLGFEIDTERAHALWKSGIATFLDARSLEDFEGGHIAQAFFFDYHRVTAEGVIPEVVDAVLSPDAPIVIYCSGGECDASHNAATVLQSLGFAQLHVYVDGYDVWAEAGHETETGPDVFTEKMP